MSEIPPGYGRHMPRPGSLVCVYILPYLTLSRRKPPPSTSSQVDRDKLYVGEPSIPRGLPAHVYLGKGYPKAGFNSATYGGIDPWLNSKRVSKGRGGGHSDAG